MKKCPFCGKLLWKGWGKRSKYLVGHNSPGDESYGVRPENQERGGNCPGSDLLLAEVSSPKNMIVRKLDHILALLEQP